MIQAISWIVAILLLTHWVKGFRWKFRAGNFDTATRTATVYENRIEYD